MVKLPHHLPGQRGQLRPPVWLAESPEVVSQAGRQTWWCRVTALKVGYGFYWDRSHWGKVSDSMTENSTQCQTESCAVNSRQFLNASLTLKIYFTGGGGGCRELRLQSRQLGCNSVWGVSLVCVLYSLFVIWPPSSVGLTDIIYLQQPPPVTLISTTSQTVVVSSVLLLTIIVLHNISRQPTLSQLGLTVKELAS